MSTESDFYKTILDDLYDGVYFVDKERRITYWNRDAERITGFKDLQVLGKRCADNMLMHVDENGTLLCETACPLTRSDVGDKVLQMVSETLRLNLRATDLVGRWGGEEDDTVESLVKRADRLMYESKSASRNRVTCGE